MSLKEKGQALIMFGQLLNNLFSKDGELMQTLQELAYQNQFKQFGEAVANRPKAMGNKKYYKENRKFIREWISKFKKTSCPAGYEEAHQNILQGLKLWLEGNDIAIKHLPGKNKKIESEAIKAYQEGTRLIDSASAKIRQIAALKAAERGPVGNIH